MMGDEAARAEQRLTRIEEELRRLAAREAIIDCTVRFCRGINRLDKEMLLSVFHPDAIDDHGFFVGNRDDFLLWIDDVYTKLSYTQHYVTNHTIELDGSQAHVESYWIVVNVPHGDGAAPILRGGRYIDRFEERDGVWAISRRVCLTEWNCAPGHYSFPPDVLAVLARSRVGARDKSDPSYMRPLEIDREPMLDRPQL